MNVQSPHKWWSTLKSAVFGSGSSLPSLVGPGGGLVCEPVGKADLQSDHFDSKQSRESDDLLVTCHPSPSLITFAFRSSEVKRLLLDLDPYGGTDPLGMFPLFLKRTADVLAPCLSVVFRRLLRLGSSLLGGDRPMSPPFQKSIVLLCCQLPTNFHDTSIVQGVRASGGGSSRTIYGTLWCVSNHPVCLSERFGYL